MPNREFVFALALSDEPHYETMLAEVTDAVLAHVGYAPAAIEELRGVLRRALHDGGDTARRCVVRFRAGEGELQITVAYAGAAEWHTRRPLP